MDFDNDIAMHPGSRTSVPRIRTSKRLEDRFEQDPRRLTIVISPNDEDQPRSEESRAKLKTQDSF